MIEKLFFSICRYRWWVVGLVILGAVVSINGLTRLSSTTDFEVYFNDDNPQLKTFNAIRARYAKSDGVLFVLAPRNGDVFTRENLSLVEQLTEWSWKMPYCRRVDSLTNYQHSYSRDDELVVKNLVDNASGLTEKDLSHIRDIVMNEPLLVKRLVSTSGHVTGVNVTFQLPDGDCRQALSEIAESARNLANKIRAANPEIAVYITGVIMLNNAFPEISQKDSETLIPILYIVILIGMWFFLPSIAVITTTVFITTATLLMTMGITGWMGVQMTPPSMASPIIILTIIVAECVHIMSMFLSNIRRGQGKTDAIVNSLMSNFKPVFLTMVTTVIGFLSMNLSDSPPFNDLGNIAAIGVFISYVVAMLLCPSLLMILPDRFILPRSSKHFKDYSKWMEALGRCALRHKRLIVSGWAFLILLAFFMISFNELDDNFVNYFDKDVPFRADTDFATSNLTGVRYLYYSLPSGKSGGINDPAYLRHVDDFRTWCLLQPEVIHVHSLTDVLKRLNFNMHNDDPRWRRLPETKDLAAQYLLLYEMSLPFGLDVNDQVDVDRSALRFTITLKNLTSKQYIAFEERAGAFLKTHCPPEMHVSGSSPTLMFAHIGDRNIRNMLGGTLSALIIISLIMMVSFRSVKQGLLGMIPNIVPCVMSFGLWGMLVGKVGLALSIVSGLTLGIVVDDTIHFVTKYLEARREHGKDPEQSVLYAFRNVGQAMFITSVCLVCGFLILIFSKYSANSEMGILTAITIAFALIADYSLLPQLLVIFDENPARKSVEAMQTDLAMNPRAKLFNRLFPQKGKDIVGMFLIGALFAAWSSPTDALAMSDHDKGYSIVSEMDRRGQGFNDTTVNLDMALITKSGESSLRRLRLTTKEMTDDGDRSVVIFDHPADIRGTALLTYAHGADSDEQWLYLPALKRVKRISSENKTGSFVGSEFAYEDMSTLVLDKYTFRYLRNEILSGSDCYVVEQIPKEKNSGYSKETLWIEKNEYFVMRIDYFDRKETLLKTLTLKDYKKYEDKFWRAQTMEMKNLQTGKATILTYGDYDFNQGLDNTLFNPNALKNIR